MVQLYPVDRSLSPASADFTADECVAMQRAVVNLFDRWGLSEKEASVLLGDISVRTFQRWKAGVFGRVNKDLAARMSNLLGVHKALRLLFKDKARGYAWIRQSNSAFGGRSALEVMLDGQLTDLMRVRHYLDAERSPW